MSPSLRPPFVRPLKGMFSSVLVIMNLCLVVNIQPIGMALSGPGRSYFGRDHGPDHN